MQKKRPFKQGARIYNLFPLLAGVIDLWPAHLRRARDMEFNWVFVNPFHYPGFSGSLYSIKDYYKINPLLVSERSSKSPMDQLKKTVEETKKLGLNMIMDLVINHTAVDSLLVKHHPAWYLWNPEGTVKNPSVWEGDRCVAVWGDLAEINNENSPDRENLWRYWEELALFYCGVGFKGFRCDAAYQVTDALWKRLIHRVKESYPGALFFAETLGCEIEDVVRLGKAGFDYTFNSSKYWDFEEPWCLSQYRENSCWTPSVSFAESHDTLRLAEELHGDEQEIKQRYLFSALFSTGVMMPMGFEFGFQKRLHVVSTRPADWEETHTDLTGFIREVNGLKKSHPVFNQDGPMEIVDVENPRVLCLKKKTFEGDECALILLNKDQKAPQAFRIPSLVSLLSEEGPAMDMTPEHLRTVLPDDFREEIPPAGYRVIHSGPCF